MAGGPVVLFDLNQHGVNDMIVLSSFSRFTATSLSQTDSIFEYGVMDSMLTNAAKYNYSMIIFYSPSDINEGSANGAY